MLNKLIPILSLFWYILVGFDCSGWLILFWGGMDLRVPKHYGRILRVTDLWAKCKYWPTATLQKVSSCMMHAQNLKHTRCFFCEDMPKCHSQWVSGPLFSQAFFRTLWDWGRADRVDFGVWMAEAVISHFLLGMTPASFIGHVTRRFASGQGSEFTYTIMTVHK